MAIGTESRQLADISGVRDIRDTDKLVEQVRLLLEESSMALQENSNIHEIKQSRERVELLRQCAKKAQLGTRIQNDIAKVRLIAERKAGKLLKSLKLRGGDRRSKSHRATLNLDDLGITRYESSRWQKEASVPEREFQRFVRETTMSNKELTSAALIRLSQQLRNGKSVPRSVNEVDNGHCCREASSCAEEILEELANHIETLHGIVTPLCDLEKPVNLRNEERRFLRRLLLDFTNLFAELRNNVLTSDDGQELMRERLLLN